MREHQHRPVTLRVALDDLAGDDGFAARRGSYQQNEPLAAGKDALELGDNVGLIRAERVHHALPRNALCTVRAASARDSPARLAASMAKRNASARSSLPSDT